jgi:general stress protein 26
MSLAHKWLEQEPWPTKIMPKNLLEVRIERALTLSNLGYLGTVRKDGSPSVSPVEFYADFIDGAPSLYIFPQPKSPKVYALLRDPRVSFAVAQPLAGWACVMGVQIFGTGTLLDPHTLEWERGMLIFKWPSSSFELGKITTTPPSGQLLRIDAQRITYTEHYMRKEGYAPRQTWLRDDDVQVVPGGNSPI